MEATVDAFLSVPTLPVPSFWREEDDKWITQNVKNKGDGESFIALAVTIKISMAEW